MVPAAYDRSYASAGWVSEESRRGKTVPLDAGLRRGKERGLLLGKEGYALMGMSSSSPANPGWKEAPLCCYSDGSLVIRHWRGL